VAEGLTTVISLQKPLVNDLLLLGVQMDLTLKMAHVQRFYYFSQYAVNYNAFKVFLAICMSTYSLLGYCLQKQTVSDISTLDICDQGRALICCWSLPAHIFLVLGPMTIFLFFPRRVFK
jgi:hypothetical protein